MHTPNRPRRRGRRAAFATLLTVAAALASAACSDPFKLKAQYANEPFVYSVYGLTSAGPANAAAALDLVSRATVKVDGSFGFDVAFDFDGQGKIRVIPQPLVGSSANGSRAVALQRLNGAYESVMLAPAHDYVADSVMTVLPGETVVVRLTSASCIYQLSSFMFAKLVVDSVKTGGLIFGRGVINPNCGFKSFADGIPDK
ncbi:MAG: hypothetical protein HYV19_06760 [Gemmatimonadetes bacterium]|nr:hypothetical protein [Gemmatimonadota bacterium]